MFIQPQANEMSGLCYQKQSVLCSKHGFVFSSAISWDTEHMAPSRAASHILAMFSAW